MLAGAIDKDVQLSVCLRRLKGANWPDIEDIHGVATATGHVIFHRCLRAIDAALPMVFDVEDEEHRWRR